MPIERLTKIVEILLHPQPADVTQFYLFAFGYIVVGGTLIAYVLRTVFYTLRLIKLTFVETFIARRTKPFAAPHPTGEKRILIVGDSTAVGAGARKPEDSIAGRLAHDYPKVDIVNVGINGARTRDAVRAMSVVAGQSFDLVIVSVGGNDIWHFTSLKKLDPTLDALLRLTKSVARGPVIFLIYNNIGSSPIFPFFMRSILKERGERVQELSRRVAERVGGISCIELFSDERDNPFLDEPSKLFSADGVHPSSEGYWLWYTRMWRLLVARGVTFSQN